MRSLCKWEDLRSLYNTFNLSQSHYTTIWQRLVTYNSTKTRDLQQQHCLVNNTWDNRIHSTTRQRPVNTCDNRWDMIHPMSSNNNTVFQQIVFQLAWPENTETKRQKTLIQAHVNKTRKIQTQKDSWTHTHSFFKTYISSWETEHKKLYY